MPRLGQIKETFKSTQTEIKASIRKQPWKEVLIFFCFVLLSFGFWVLQSLQQEYEIEINIPVKYKNIPPDIAFTEAPIEKVTAKVKDRGSLLLNYTFGRSFAPIEVSMKNQTEEGKLMVSKKSIESDIQKQLIATTTLVDFEPQQVEVVYSKRIRKEIPVAFVGSIQTHAGFKQSGDLIINPHTVSVYTTQQVLDTLKEVKPVFAEIKNGTKTTTRTLQLQKVGGAVVEPTQVSVTIPIEEYTEKELEIPVTCKDLPAHYKLRTFPSVVKVICSLPLSRFKELSANDFMIDIAFADLEQNVSGTLPLHFDKKPSWVDAATITPNRIEFILEQSND